MQLKSFLPHIFAVLLFVILGYLSFPSQIEGKQIRQNDIVMWTGSAQEIEQYRAEHGEEPLWTNAMFSGMPATMVSVLYKGNFLEPVYKALFWGERPASYMILAMISFYLLMLACGVNSWLGILGAVSFAFCAYNFQILQVGHNTKFVAMALMPMVLAAAVFAYRKKALLGAVLFGIALSFEVMANHVQITYYLAFVLIFYGLSEMYVAWKDKKITKFFKTTSLIILFGLLGVASNINHLWPAWEYTQHTMRGGSELSFDKGVQTGGGLKSDYVTDWSYGIEESLNLLIPDLKGGSSSGVLDTDSETYRVLKENNIPNANQIIGQMPLYWGTQPSTAGPVYLGAIVIFLFVMGLCLIKGPARIWMAGVVILALFLAWGRNMMWLTDFFLQFVPLYNKFRGVTLILVIVQMVVPLLGFYALHGIFTGAFEKQKVLNALKIAVGVTAGICILFVVFPGLAGDFTKNTDASLPEWLKNSLIEDRKSLLKFDALRSLFFIVLGAGVVLAGYLRKIAFPYLVVILGGLIFLDLRTVDMRYLSSSDFVKPAEINNAFALRPVDESILKDEDPDYRVWDATSNTFNDAVTSYHHKSIGGYSAAKLQRYQDLIDYHLSGEMQAFIEKVQVAKTMEGVDSALRVFNVLNMLNTKYLILNPESEALKNVYAQGHAWFVKDIHWVSNADEEILALDSVDLRSTAVVDQRFKTEVMALSADSVETGSIELTS